MDMKILFITPFCLGFLPPKDSKLLWDSLYPFCDCGCRVDVYALENISDFEFVSIPTQEPTEQRKAVVRSRCLSLGTMASSELCPHRGDHLRNRCRMGRPGRAGSHRYSPCQPPLLLRGWVWQPAQICPQGHPEHLHRVQLTASELKSQQVKHQPMLLALLALGWSPTLYGAAGHMGAWCRDVLLLFASAVLCTSKLEGRKVITGV